MNLNIKHCRALFSFLLLSGFVLGLSPRAVLAEDKPVEQKKEEIKTVELEKVRDFIDKEVRVEFKVLGANLKDEKSNCFLNSKKDFKAKDNFTVIIFPKTLKKFKEAKIDDPAMYYMNKTIQVVGKIVIHKDRRDRETPQIVVESPEQITIVKDEKKDDKPAEVKIEKTK